MATVEELYNHTLFWRSDNSRFWYYNDDKGFHTFKAVTLSDTGTVERLDKILFLGCVTPLPEASHAT